MYESAVPRGSACRNSGYRADGSRRTLPWYTRRAFCSPQLRASFQMETFSHRDPGNLGNKTARVHSFISILVLDMVWNVSRAAEGDLTTFQIDLHLDIESCTKQ